MPMARKLLITLLAGVALSPIALASAAEAAPAGQVLIMLGQCFDQANGQRTPLRMGSSVAVGDTVDVPAGAKIKLRMVDGSVLSLGSGTSLTIRAYGVDASGHRDAEMALGSGLLRAVVTAVAQPQKFEVATATGVAAVRSTDWFILAPQGSTQVGVLRGDVVLTSRATDHSVAIPARWGARVEAGRDPVPARLWTPQEFADVIRRTDVQ
jgi:hypothetical protein